MKERMTRENTVAEAYGSRRSPTNVTGDGERDTT